MALFVPGFPLSALAPFSLCGQSVSLVAILAALSPHPKIPFLADGPWRSKPATFATLEPDLGGIDPGGGGGVRYCCGLSTNIDDRHAIPITLIITSMLIMALYYDVTWFSP
jgi:hypothetical protein